MSDNWKVFLGATAFTLLIGGAIILNTILEVKTINKEGNYQKKMNDQCLQDKKKDYQCFGITGYYPKELIE